MSNEKLPPELVQRMYNVQKPYTNSNLAEKCAQIAVDYAEEELKPILIQNSQLSEKNHRLVAERLRLEIQCSELIELLKKVSYQFSAMPDGYDPGNCNGEILYTLKKHQQ